METIFHYSIYLQFFIGLFAVVNPIGFLPIFYSMTEHQYEAERNHTNFVTSTSVCLILLTTLFFGKMILDVFSISLDSFRVAGGFLIVTIAITMINGKLGDHRQNKEEKNTDISEYDNIGVVPLAMPMMAGPGAIGSTIVWGSHYNQWTDYLGFSISIIVFTFTCYAALRFSAPLIKRLGRTGSNIITRIMGLILMSLGIEFIVTGLGNLFPGLVTV
ncbi:YchE family NAAT transporter [Phocoenobacter skyensis]|uniref:UPF0056 membrane protein n=1 Tax=Phocoenobacter skyensis TaxID=97481 RepID=A0A1H7YG69_9PAST|nr:YchE family NAAT transporter [Pasteurella skyensis]MDP8079753.1 YchE family NAAT transporter [Pasteurella skyensis]MDP8085672.1 YchE family NAAT transporter [Pasteurella skyensis]MDP8163000.1 YchE family NAAT transporter [Pasteurella skyensis]MDP8170072.1 YchE family NAAT transporter [Pasteurella skyensis]MDP8172848.1 YchE family NAAT transporter [Pasteurella skyensis]